MIQSYQKYTISSLELFAPTTDQAHACVGFLLAKHIKSAQIMLKIKHYYSRELIWC